MGFFFRCFGRIAEFRGLGKLFRNLNNLTKEQLGILIYKVDAQLLQSGIELDLRAVRVIQKHATVIEGFDAAYKALKHR